MVPSLAREVLSSTGGVTSSDFWHRLTPSGLFVYTCPAITRLFGHLPDQLLGTSIVQFIRPEQREVFKGALKNAAEQGTASAMRHSLKDKHDHWREVVTTFFPPSSQHSGGRYHREALIVCQTSLMAAKLDNQPSFAQVPLGQTVPFIASDLSNDNRQNVFAELQPNRNSSWQFELQSLQRSNRSMQAEIAKLEQLKASASAGRRNSSAPAQRTKTHTPSSGPPQTSAHVSPLFMPNCINCGSSDIGPDQ